MTARSDCVLEENPGPWCETPDAMSFLRKLLGKPPTWADFFTGAEFKAFLDAIRAELNRAGAVYRMDAGSGVVQAQIPGQTGVQNLGLLNAAQVCRHNPREEWPEIIARHLRIMTNIPQLNADIEAFRADFHRAREFLKVRIHPKDYVAQLPDSIAYQPVGEGLIAVLVYDFPDSVAGVPPSHVEGWRVPMHDLIQLGLRNVCQEGLLEPDRVDVPSGGWIDAYEDGDNYFAASHALLLHEYFDPEPELGVLVGIPHRHGMLLRPIDDASVLHALSAMFHLIPVLYDQGPGAISRDLFWYRAGTFTRLPFERKGDTINFRPPDSFLEQVAEKLGGDGLLPPAS